MLWLVAPIYEPLQIHLQNKFIDQIFFIFHSKWCLLYHVPSSNDYKNWTLFGKFANKVWIHRNRVSPRYESFDAPINRTNEQNKMKEGKVYRLRLCVLTTRFAFNLKPFPQKSHINGLHINPLWYSRWRMRLIFFRNALSQPSWSHLNSCECVCVFRWSCIVRFLLNPKLQISHLKGLLSLWTVIWVDRPPFCVNDRPHSSPAID